LNKDNVTRTDLTSWINQHPSLVAEIGTLRRLSKKRLPLNQSAVGIESQDGSSEWNESLQTFGANSNNNNNFSPRSRPRSSAIGAADLNLAYFPDDNKSLTLPAIPGSSRRRRKLHPNRPIQSSSSINKPYLETDL